MQTKYENGKGSARQDLELNIADFNKRIIAEISFVKNACDLERYQIINICEEIVKSTEKLLNTSVIIVTNKIYDLLEEVTNNGLDGSKCLGDKIDKINGVPTAVVKNIATFVKGQIDIAHKKADDTIEILDKSLDYPVELMSDLKVCGLQNTLCKSRLLAKTVSNISIFVADLSVLGNKLTESNINVVEEAGNYSSTSIEKAIDDIHALSKDITSCLNDILG